MVGDAEQHARPHWPVIVLALLVSVGLHACLLFYALPTSAPEPAFQPGRIAVRIPPAPVAKPPPPPPAPLPPSPPPPALDIPEPLPPPQPLTPPPLPPKLPTPKPAQPPIPRPTPPPPTVSLPPIPTMVPPSQTSLQPLAASQATEPDSTPSPRPVGVTSPARPARPISRPVYPRISRRMGEEGRVTIDAQIRADGSTGTVRVRITSTYQRLDDAAVQAVQKTRFLPATRGGIPVPSIVTLTFTFRLDDE